MPVITTRLAARYATFAAAAAVVVTPLLALSYFAIPDGAPELETGSVSAWADPARDLAGGLLTFGSPDRVYATYTQVLAALFPAALICALMAWSRRPRPASRTERWGWPVALAGYASMTAGLITASVVLIGASASGDAVNTVFVSLVVPGLLLSTTGSTVLGIGLLREGRPPRGGAWALAELGATGVKIASQKIEDYVDYAPLTALKSRGFLDEMAKRYGVQGTRR